MARFIYLWVLVYLLCFFHAHSQLREENVRFFHLNAQAGLSQSSIFAIEQDHLGLMWIGTRDGLNKYDARKFVAYRNILSDSTSLSDSYVTSIHEDRNKRLWIGTAQGLNLYDRNADRFQRILFVGLTQNQPLVSSIVEDRKGQVWFCTSLGLFVLPPNSKELAPMLAFDGKNVPGVRLPSSSRYVQHLYEDHLGRLWVSTIHGVYLFSALSPDKPPVFIKSFLMDQGMLRNADVRFVYEMKPGVFWFGTKEEGINVYTEKTDRFHYLSDPSAKQHGTLNCKDIRSIVQDRQGGYWIGTINGLYAYTEKDGFTAFRNNEWNPYSLSDNSVRPIFQDRRGSIWVGTYYGGINIYDRNLPYFRNYFRSSSEKSLSYNVVSGILQDKNRNFWIGTEGGGLNYMSEDKKVLEKYVHEAQNSSSLSSNHVKCIYLDTKENLWIGTYTGGLNVLYKGRKDFVHYKHDSRNRNSISDNNVYAIMEDQEGDMWIGTYGGGVSVKRSNSDEFFQHYRSTLQGDHKISSDLVRKIYIDSRKNIWIGTEYGLNVKWFGKNSFEQFFSSESDRKSISGNIIISIYEDSKGRLLIGTFKNGLNKFDYKTKTFERYDEENGLPGRDIFGMVEERGTLWISTNKGIGAYNLDDNKAKKYNIKDGLLGNEFSIGAVCKAYSGEILFGGTHGITAFMPKDMPTSAYHPTTIFTDFRIFNKSVKIGPDEVLTAHVSTRPHITLNYKQNIFSVDFATLNYVIPDKNKYAYRLDGLEDDWNYVSVPTTTYTNLAAGEYTLLIKGASNDGVWSDVPQKLQITILPPPWKTWWAYLIYSAIILAIVYYIVQFTKSKSELRYQLHLKAMEADNERKLTEVKSNFFMQVSHELRTPLTLILSPLDYILPSLNSDHVLKPTLLTMRRNAQRLLQLVNELLDLRKQELGGIKLKVQRLDICKFINQILSSFHEEMEQKGIRVEIESIEKEVFVGIDAAQMQKVFYNLLSNSLKYIAKNGQIKIKIAHISNKVQEQDYIRIEVLDNGMGIPDEEQDAIFELFYQAEKQSQGQRNYGSGIGLALTQNIVQLHGGTIRVNSHYDPEYIDSFTCFTIDLPLNSHFLADEAVLEQQDFFADEVLEEYTETTTFDASEVRDKEEEVVVMQPIKSEQNSVLVVDDNEDILSFLCDGLSAYYQVLSATDGQQALLVIQDQLPDIIISDVMMPNLDGVSLLKKIKNNVSTSHIPVLLLTALSSTEDIRSGMYAGSDDYIVKPVNLEILRLKLQNILTTRKNFRKNFIQEYILKEEKDNATCYNDEYEFLTKVVRFVEDNLSENDLNVVSLSLELGMSRPVVYRKVKQLTGLSVIELINLIRMRNAAKLLCDSGLIISEVAYKIGYTDPKYFSKTFKIFYGITPSQFAALDIHDKATLMDTNNLFSILKALKIEM